MPHRKKFNILNNPPAEAPPPVLRLKPVAEGFLVDIAGRDERWTPQQLFEYLLARGYSHEDADATVAQARIASEIHISLPSVH